MDTWLKEELHKIAEADDLHISPFREDGVTYAMISSTMHTVRSTKAAPI